MQPPPTRKQELPRELTALPTEDAIDGPRHKGIFPLPYMVITCSPLPINNGNLPLPLLVVITLLLSFLILINDCICILTG